MALNNAAHARNPLIGPTRDETQVALLHQNHRVGINPTGKLLSATLGLLEAKARDERMPTSTRWGEGSRSLCRDDTERVGVVDSSKNGGSTTIECAASSPPESEEAAMLLNRKCRGSFE